MPRIGGRELAEVLSVFRPELPVVGMTGFAGAVHPDRRLPVLIKPFTLPALLDAVRSARRRRASPPTVPVEQRSRARRLRALAAERADEELDLVTAAGLLRQLAEPG
jgi:FixJ family two-component response regulator